MPYPGVPSSLTKKMERCVAHLKRKGGVKNVYAVCHASIMGKHKQSENKKNRAALSRLAKKKKK